MPECRKNLFAWYYDYDNNEWKYMTGSALMWVKGMNFPIFKGMLLGYVWHIEENV